MNTFEVKHISFLNRILFWKNFGFLLLFLFYTFLIFNFKLIKPYSLILEIIILSILIIFILNKSKTYIYKVSFEGTKIIFEGETFNTKWEERIDINETNIKITGEAAKNINNRVYFLKFKNLKRVYTINSLETFSDEELLSIFKNFKELKNENIDYNDTYLLERIQEKIEKYR